MNLNLFADQEVEVEVVAGRDSAENQVVSGVVQGSNEKFSHLTWFGRMSVCGRCSSGDAT